VLHMMGAMNAPLPEVTNASEAANAARKLLDQGVDGIKLFASSPRSAALPQSAIEAAAKEAHRFGNAVFVHLNNGVDVLAVLRASLTAVPAGRFGGSARLSRFAAGVQAGLVVLRGDPARNIPPLAAVQHTSPTARLIHHTGLRI